jgi:hypothetical protein
VFCLTTVTLLTVAPDGYLLQGALIKKLAETRSRSEHFARASGQRSITHRARPSTLRILADPNTIQVCSSTVSDPTSDYRIVKRMREV